MPQEGLNVFYRFFRDRISWFEADAVCQFHHANLVTVDNSFQFDATRDLLRELDVNDIVWIGLMRPQNSDRFMWSNSRPLVVDTGYWAESLPLMDAPLCAVIDPIRDYRWHALRCGGPETASFLCEMPVPSWADVCNLKDMPNLTLQYMADTASIELIRNCQEEGLLRTMCRGKQDRERALQDLICPRERLEAQRINDITNSHFKSLQIINSIPSDNNENNDIELLPMEVNYGAQYPEELQTEKNTVQRLIEQFNVDELMQADEPSNMETISSFYKIPGLIPKPVKKSAKKVLDYPKKDSGKQKGPIISIEQTQKDKKRLPVEMEEMMMGDQPLQGEPELPDQFLNEEVSNEILEPLPHIKKTIMIKKDGLEEIEKEATAMKKNMQMSKEMENKKLFMMSPAKTATPSTATTQSPTTKILIPSISSTTEIPLTTTPAVITIKADEERRVTEEHLNKSDHEISLQLDKNGGHLITTISPVTIGHPIHPQQPHSNIFTELSQHPHTKESTDSSHFIPPLLMVKSHYIPPDSKHGHSEYEHHIHQQQQLQQHHQLLHLQTTTEGHAETTIKHEDNKTSEPTITTASVTFKALDSQEAANKKVIIVGGQEEHQAALTTTESNGAEMERTKNTPILYDEEKQTTMTANILQSAAFTTLKSIATDSEEVNKNNAGPEIDKEEKQETNLPEITHVADETTEATKLVETTEKSLMFTKKLYELETATHSTEKIKEIADTTAIDQQQLQHVPTMEEQLTAIKTKENKEHLQTTTGTTEKPVATKRAEVITALTTVLAPATQQTSTATETQSLQQIQKDQANKQQQEEEDKHNDHDIKETVVKTTEIPVTLTSTAIGIAKSEEKVEVEEENKDTPAIAATSSRSETATTTIKPITITLSTNEVKSTETSFSSTKVIISSTTTTTTTNIPTTTIEDNTSTTTLTVPTTTTALTSTLPSSVPATITTAKITTNKREADAKDEAESVTTTTATIATATARVETSTETPTPPETTTRNFLKVTTEMPFKPNRRRVLTKPETVSYMKKVLG